MKNKEEFINLLKSVALTISIVFLIVIGLYLIRGGVILGGYFNYFGGGMLIYFLCCNYFKNEGLKKKK